MKQPLFKVGEEYTLDDDNGYNCVNIKNDVATFHPALEEIDLENVAYFLEVIKLDLYTGKNLGPSYGFEQYFDRQ